MNSTEKKFPIEIVMLSFIIILIMYIYCYNKGSIFFWGFFAIERLLSLTYDEEIDQYLNEVDVREVNVRTMIVVTIFSIISVGIFIWTPFKYPGLFIILIVGELIDFVIKKAKQKLNWK